MHRPDGGCDRAGGFALVADAGAGECCGNAKGAALVVRVIIANTAAESIPPDKNMPNGTSLR